MNQVEQMVEDVKQCRRSVMAAMETGNPERARTLVRELGAVNFQGACDIRADVAQAYGTDI